MSLDFEKIILFGDSITELSYNSDPLALGTPQFTFGSAMTNAYVRCLDVVQRGYGGYNSEQARILLPKILNHETVKTVRLITIFFGTNDACLDGIQKVELSRYCENMRYLIETAISHGIKVVVIGPGFHDSERWEKEHVEDVNQGLVRQIANNKIYSEALKEIAEEYKIAFVNMFDVSAAYDSVDDQSYNDLLTDGIHYTGKGYQLMFDETIKQIGDFYPELHPSKVKNQLPLWREATYEQLKQLK